MMAIGSGEPRLAVILSKFDALRALRDVDGSEWSMVMSNAGAAYLRDPPTPFSTTTTTVNCCTKRCAAC